MKAQITIEDRFKPVTLAITFESKEELDLTAQLFSTDAVIDGYEDKGMGSQISKIIGALHIEEVDVALCDRVWNPYFAKVHGTESQSIQRLRETINEKLDNLVELGPDTQEVKIEIATLKWVISSITKTRFVP